MGAVPGAPGGPRRSRRCGKHPRGSFTACPGRDAIVIIIIVIIVVVIRIINIIIDIIIMIMIIIIVIYYYDY